MANKDASTGSVTTEWTVKTSLDRLVDEFGMDKINAVTQYPSILNYHSMDSRGVLTSDLNFCMEEYDPEESLYITEKLDGTNARKISIEGAEDYFIGSRREILYACGDRIINQTQRIVPTLLDKMSNKLPQRAVKGSVLLTVIYCEVYGEAINKLIQYGKDSNYRIFDVSVMSDYRDVLSKSSAEIATWRQQNTDRFLSSPINISYNPEMWVPFLTTTEMADMPTTLSDTRDWLMQFKDTRIPECPEKTKKKNPYTAEGVIVRSADRSFIRKLRFKDYDRADREGIF